MQKVWFQIAVESATGILGIGYLPKNVYTMKKALVFDGLCNSARINNDTLNECTMIAIEQKTSGQKKNMIVIWNFVAVKCFPIIAIIVRYYR